MRPLTKLNEGKSYPDQIKPFNFLLTCHVRPLGHPRGVKPERFHLIAPYETDSRQWLTKNWIDQYSGKEYRITTVGSYGGSETARVKTYGDVLVEYEYHPESKCADADGNTCSKQTVGLLQRRHVRIDQIKYIGKESNSLEEVESGLIHSSRMFTRNIQTRDGTNGKRRLCPRLRKPHYPVWLKSAVEHFLAGLSLRYAPGAAGLIVKTRNSSRRLFENQNCAASLTSSFSKQPYCRQVCQEPVPTDHGF